MEEQTTDKSISEADFLRLWGDLSHNQQRFAVAMLECPSKKEAAIAIRLEPDTVYRWGSGLDDVIDYMRGRARDAASGVLVSSVIKAATIKRAGLDSGEEKIRQDVASEILDRVLGRATQRQDIDVTTKGESLNDGKLTGDQHARAIATLLDTLATRHGGGDSGEPDAVGAAERAAMAGTAE